MLLAVDIGNTNINCGLFRGRRLQKTFLMPTKGYRLNKFKKNLGKAKIDNALICSVVPKINNTIEKDIFNLTGKKPKLIGRDIFVPVKNLYRKPKEVGQDRLVNAYAGILLYGAPLISIDFGTAITFDIVSKKKGYLGGMILPGLEISLEILSQKTALLPRIKLARPREFIGKDTRNSILSGIIYGFAALTDDLAARIKAKIGRKAKVIATGGNANLISTYCRRIDKVDTELTLKRLNLIFKKNS